MVTPQAVRRVVWTGAIAAITITGTIYGATLKSDVQAGQARKRALEATLEEKIISLENVRGGLITKKIELERKMERFSARQLNKQQEEERKPR